MTRKRKTIPEQVKSFMGKKKVLGYGDAVRLVEMVLDEGDSDSMPSTTPAPREGVGFRPIDSKRYLDKTSEEASPSSPSSSNPPKKKFVSVVLGTKDFSWFSGESIAPDTTSPSRSPSSDAVCSVVTPDRMTKQEAIYQIRGNLNCGDVVKPQHPGILLLRQASCGDCSSLLQILKLESEVSELDPENTNARGVTGIDKNWKVTKYTKQYVTEGWACLEASPTPCTPATDPCMDRLPPHRISNRKQFTQATLSACLQLSPLHIHTTQDTTATPGNTSASPQPFIFKDPG
eukprot:TRINITY_DN5613_c2_g1_i1.p1 TRINITY_DN5613_c2_g1~~TRINITY_DN5613_c2_g1_i1.p1  ORF type:complete len:289 (+),score=34.85 TRINITY_DN5613_c2_g1_i1:120-986(+)